METSKLSLELAHCEFLLQLCKAKGINTLLSADDVQSALDAIESDASKSTYLNRVRRMVHELLYSPPR